MPDACSKFIQKAADSKSKEPKKVPGSAKIPRVVGVVVSGGFRVATSCWCYTNYIQLHCVGIWTPSAHTHRQVTHTHTLAQNCHCEFCCGMHLMCNTLPLYIYTWQEWVLTGMGRLRDLKTLRSYHRHSQRVAPTRTRKSNWLTQICWNSTGRLMVWPDAIFRNEERNWSEMETDPEQQVITTSSSMVETATEWKHGRQQNCQVRNE